MRKLPLSELIAQMLPDHQRVCRRIYADYRELIDALPGSTAKHQAWPGGYTAHLEESMNIALVLYGALSRCRPLPFDQEDALFALFIHDFDKVLRYKKVDGGYRAAGAYTSDYPEEIKQLLRT